MATQADRANHVRRTTPGEARWALLLLFVVAIFNYIDRSLLSVLQVQIKADLNLSDTQLGALTGLAFAAVYAIAALPLARIVDRGRRTWILAAALAIWTGMTALTGFATGFATLVLLRIGVALGEAASVPCTHSLISDYFPLRSRGSALAIWALASPLGIMIGMFSAGWLGDDFGWRASFIWIGVAGGILVLPLLLLREPVRGESDEQAIPLDAPAAGLPPLRDAFGLLWASRPFRLLIAGTTLQGFVYTSLLNWAPPFYARIHALPLTEMAMWSGLMIGIGGGIGALTGGLLVDRLGRRDAGWYGWAPGLAIGLSIPVGLAQLLVDAPMLSIALGFVTICLASCYIAPVNATAQSLVPPTMRGLTAAVVLLVPTLVGQGLGPMLTGVASDWLANRMGLGDQSLRYALAMVLLVSAGASILLIRMGFTLRREPVIAARYADR